MTDDRALLRIVTSANVACGFHAGDPHTMRAVAMEAAELGVAVGAHVSYRDRAGFGRRPMAVAHDELRADVLDQIAALARCCAAAGTRVRYVKPHGALYNTIVHDTEQAAAVVAGVHAFDPSLPVLGLPGSAFLSQAAAAGSSTVPEGFPDRAYASDGTLVSRQQSGSVLHDPEEVAHRAVRLATAGEVESGDGAILPMAVRSLCVHGDNPEAAAIATRVREALLAADVDLAPFA